MSLHYMEQLMMRGIEVDKEKEEKNRERSIYNAVWCVFVCVDDEQYPCLPLAIFLGVKMVMTLCLCACVCSEHAPPSLCLCTCKRMCLPVWAEETSV